MKRILAFLIVLVMVLAMVGCQQQQEKADSADSGKTYHLDHKTFSVGYARVDISPELSVPMAGFGNTTDRMSQNIQDYLAGKRIIGLTGVLADKDYGEMYKPLLPLIAQFVCITPPSDRKLEAAELAKHLQAVGATATPCATIAEGVTLAKQLADKNGVVLCFGSLYSIGEIQSTL